MAGELNAAPYGMPISFALTIANPAANATTVLVTPAQAAVGYVVPAGYVFHPMGIMAAANAALGAGTATFNVTGGAVAIAGGPTAQLAVGTQQASGIARFGAAPQAAGTVISGNIVTSAAYAANTVDHDVVIFGMLALN